MVWFKDQKEDPSQTTVKPDRLWIRHVRFPEAASFFVPNALFLLSLSVDGTPYLGPIRLIETQKSR